MSKGVWIGLAIVAIMTIVNLCLLVYHLSQKSERTELPVQAEEPAPSGKLVAETTKSSTAVRFIYELSLIVDELGGQGPIAEAARDLTKFIETRDLGTRQKLISAVRFFRDIQDENVVKLEIILSYINNDILRRLKNNRLGTMDTFSQFAETAPIIQYVL